MAETIWVRFSAGGAAVAEVAALPVVVLDLLSLAAVLSLLMPSLDCASFVPSLLMLSLDCAFFVLSLLMLSLDWAFFMPPLAPSLDSAPFTPDDPPESRFMGAAEGAPRSEDGALCCADEPAPPPALPAPPAPCE